MAQVMTEIEFAEIAEEHGGTFASWEIIDRLLKLWLQEHPDNERTLNELMEAEEFLAWI